VGKLILFHPGKKLPKKGGEKRPFSGGDWKTRKKRGKKEGGTRQKSLPLKKEHKRTPKAKERSSGCSNKARAFLWGKRTRKVFCKREEIKVIRKRRVWGRGGGSTGNKGGERNIVGGE